MILVGIILVGIIPGHINSYLEPLGLILLWKGIDMTTPEGSKAIRAAFLCSSRRICTWLHGAIKGCSRCLKSFPTASFGITVVLIGQLGQ